MSEDPTTEAGQLETVGSALSRFGREKRYLLPILQMIQETCGYLPSDAIRMAADHVDIPACEAYGVATFYNQFRFTPPGENPIRICLGTACHVRGGEAILETFERTLDIEEGQTTDDRLFSIEKVACVGCCALAPVVTVDDSVHGNMAFNKVPLVIEKYRDKK